MTTWSFYLRHRLRTRIRGILKTSIGRPRTWMGIIRQRSQFEVSVNEAMASLMRRGMEPCKREICEELGLDYDNANDRAKITLAIHKHKKLFDYAWRDVYVGIGLFDRDYQKVADDVMGYRSWRKRKADLYMMLRRIGLPEERVHELWVYSQLWERFLEAANSWNLHLFVAFGQPFVRDGYRYRQPNFWDYMVKQIEIARNLEKGVLTILQRHQDLGMILTSAEPVEIVIQTARDTLKMIIDGPPLRYRCEICADEGRIIAYRTQLELVEHYRQVHNI